MAKARAFRWLAATLMVAGVGVVTGTMLHLRGSSPSQPAYAASLPPNMANIDAQNRDLFTVRDAKSRPVVGEPAVRLRIPALGIDSPVIRTSAIPAASGAGVWQVADWAVGYLASSPNPGRCTTFFGQLNCSTDVAAHDDIKGELFKRIGSLRNGQRVFVYTRKTVFTYVVDGRQIVDPTDGSVLYSNVKSLTMVTCRPYWIDNQRLAVFARLSHIRARRHHHRHKLA